MLSRISRQRAVRTAERPGRLLSDTSDIGVDDDDEPAGTATGAGSKTTGATPPADAG